MKPDRKVGEMFGKIQDAAGWGVKKYVLKKWKMQKNIICRKGELEELGEKNPDKFSVSKIIGTKAIQKIF